VLVRTSDAERAAEMLARLADHERPGS
jgi:hypothetical protein